MSDESGPAPAGSEVPYLFMTVKAIRGREAATKTKWESQGWQLVSQTQGTLRSELNFRKVKPRGLGAYIAQGYAAFRGLNPQAQVGLLAGVGALLLVGILGIALGSLSGGNAPTPAAAPPTTPATAPTRPTADATKAPEKTSAAPATPSAEPSITKITVDGLGPVTKPAFNSETYKDRHAVEAGFNHLKHHRGFATRYDKLAVRYTSTVHIASIDHWLRRLS